MSDNEGDQEKANDLEDLNKILDRALAAQKEMYSLGQNYNQFMIGAGYAAYLTLWAKMAPSLPRNVVLLSGAFLGTSLFIFIFYHIIQMLLRAIPALKMGRELQTAKSTLEKLLAFEHYGAATLKGMSWSAKLWPFVFLSATGLAVFSISMIIGSAFWGVVYSAH